MLGGKRGLTIEYVLVMMALVAAFIVLVLTTVSLTSERAGAYREYIERKALLDDIGQSFIDARLAGETPDLDAFSDNEENFQWIVSGDSLIVKSLKKIELVVELARVDGALKVVVYRYGVL